PLCGSFAPTSRKKPSFRSPKNCQTNSLSGGGRMLSVTIRFNLPQRNYDSAEGKHNDCAASKGGISCDSSNQSLHCGEAAAGAPREFSAFASNWSSNHNGVAPLHAGTRARSAFVPGLSGG